jgi:hypothetical protein
MITISYEINRHAELVESCAKAIAKAMDVTDLATTWRIADKIDKLGEHPPEICATCYFKDTDAGVAICGFRDTESAERFAVAVTDRMAELGIEVTVKQKPSYAR